jgi:glycosyltransferase involved in cell wall biosynthesis
VSIVVPSRDRPLRLRWLLNALAEQTLDRDQWEVIVAHDSVGPETEQLLRSHPLAAAGVLTHLTYPPATCGPALKRNAGWQAARAPLVAFTDDDCRPPSDWVANVLAAAHVHPGAIVQGATEIDPDELVIKQHAPHARTQQVAPDTPQGFWAQTCNIAYPVAALQLTGGFDESLPSAAGEDTDLAIRARAAGVEYVAAPQVLTYHCVEPAGVQARVRESWRWQHLPFLTRRHPELRGRYAGHGYFWKPQHVRVPFLLAGLVAVARRRPLLGLLLSLPWAAGSLPAYGSSARGRARALSELPGHAVIDVAEFAALARGSIRHRSLLL